MWWFLLIPFIWVVISKIIWHNQISFKECGIHLASVIPITALIFGIAYQSSVGDTLLIHGQVTQKVRDNDSHQESYDCRCRTVTSGSGNNKTSRRVCDTCWRTVYTVDWYLKSTIGSIDIDSERSYNRLVWDTPDPLLYQKAYVGEPCTKHEYYKNYVKGAPNSLFNNSSYKIETKLPIPEYPKTFNIYQVNNVLNVGTGVNPSLYEDLLSEGLKTLGAKKQVNIILIFVNTTDKNYRYALERAWIGGKKNDVVIIIGTTDNKNVLWADGFTFGLSQGNQFLLTTTLDSLRGKELTGEYVIPTITTSVNESFKRKQMEDFKYLARSVEPSTFLLVFVFIFQLLANIGITIWSIRNDN